MSSEWCIIHVVILIFITRVNGDYYKIVSVQDDEGQSNRFSENIIPVHSHSAARAQLTYQNLFSRPFAALQNDVFLRRKDQKVKKLKEEHQYLNIINILKNIPHIIDSIENLKTTENSKYLSSLNDSCLSDLRLTIMSAEKEQYWALEMLDAAGKVSPGVLMGNFIFPGNFDECQSVITNQTFDTKYCSTTIKLSKLKQYKLPNKVLFNIGLCVPDTCDDQSLQIVIQLALSGLKNVTANVIDTECKVEDNPLSTLAVVIICFCSLYVSLLVIATLYDIFYVNKFWQKIFVTQWTSSVQLDMEADRDVLIFSNRSNSDLGESYQALVNDSRMPRDIQSLPGKLLLSFSIYSNGLKILSTKQAPESIGCIYGLKFISLTWVILGHCFFFGIPVARNVLKYAEMSYKRWTFMAISNAFVSVDTFFVLSGCLVTYLTMKRIQNVRLSGKFFACFYLHRYWRLTPPYMLTLMLYAVLFKYISDGPFWPQGGFETDECQHNWWTNLLYINNLVKTKEMCMGWSWYLADDMQFYIVSPLIFLPLFYYGSKGLLAPFVALLFTAIISGVISQEYTIPASSNFFEKNKVDSFHVYYIKPYTRIGAYVVGMLTGYLLHKCQCRAKISRVTVLAGWIVVIAIGLSVVYGVFENTNGHPFSVQVSALYNALHKIAWGVAISWVIFACANGYGGFVNSLLSWRLFVPLSKLTYCAYLVHPMVILFYYRSQRSLIHADNINLSFVFAGAVVVSYAAAFLTSLAFESPMLALEKVLLNHRFHRPTQPPDIAPIVT